MTDERYHELVINDDKELTPEEFAEGWHFCPCWDDLLIGPGMSELDYCYCDAWRDK